MNKKKFTFLTVIMTVLMILSLSIFAACDKAPSSEDNKPVEIKPTEGLVIQNSDFKVVGDGEYPKKINSWSSGRTYSSDYYPSDVIAGAINLTEAEYNKNKSKWDDGNNTIYNLLKSHLDADKDAINNILGIYMPHEQKDSKVKQGPTAFSFTSPSFTLDKDSYYKISVDVLTHDIKGNDNLKPEDGEKKPGANLYISTATYQEFETINTEDAWQTFNFYIETSPINSASLSLRLSLGNATSSDSKTGLTSGYAFFDNIKVEKLEDVKDGKTARATYYDAIADSQTVEGKKTIRTASLNIPNEYFDFSSKSISSNAAPYGWSVVTGNSGKSDSAPHTSYSRNGVINPYDIEKDALKYGVTINRKTGDSTITSVETGSFLTNDETDLANIIVKGFDANIGNTNNIYMLSQQYMTAQGLKSSSKLTIEKNQYYKLSINVFGFNILGDGITLKLTSSDGKTIAIEGIQRKHDSRTVDSYQNLYLGKDFSTGDLLGNTAAQWTTYDFLIKGNQFKDYNYDLTLWLGTGGTGDNTEIKYKKYTSTSNTSGTDDITYMGNGTFSTGWAFFDNISFMNVTEDEMNKLKADAQNPTSVLDTTKDDFVADANVEHKRVYIDLATTNMFDGVIDTNTPKPKIATTAADNKPEYTNVNGLPKGWEVDDLIKENPAFVNKNNTYIGTMDINQENFSTTIPGLLDPLQPYDIAQKSALVMSIVKQPSTVAVRTNATLPATSDPASDNHCIKISANKFYRISMWVKTQFVSPSSGLYLYLMDASDKDEDPVAAISFDKINTDSIKENNGWQEVTFLVRGNQVEDKYVYLKASLGTGNRFAISTLTTGSAFITNMSMTEITYDNFKDTSTSTYVKSKDYSTTPISSTFTNGRFDSYDQSDKNLYNDNIDKTLRIPNNFKASDKLPELIVTEGEGTEKVETIDKTCLRAGILSLKEVKEGLQYEASTQATNVFPTLYDTVFNHLYDSSLVENLGHIGGPNLLAIGFDSGSNKAVFSYESDSLSLGKESKYKISVWAKTLNGAKATIKLAGESMQGGKEQFVFDDTTVESTKKYNGWTLYNFYIETSIFEVSLKLTLGLGDLSKAEVADQESSGLVLFDTVTLTKLDNDFTLPTNNSTEISISLTTDGFTTSTKNDNNLLLPLNWSGSVDTNQDKDNTKSGVVDVTSASTSNDGTHVDFLGNANLKREDVPKPTNDEIQKKFDEFVADTHYNASAPDNYKVPEKDSYFDRKPFNQESYKSTKEGAVRQDIFDLIVDKKFEELTDTSRITLDELKYDKDTNKNSVFLGNQFLVINNIKASAYTYSSPSYTFTAGQYYKISVMVRTFGVDLKDKDGNVIEDNGAYIELYLGSANKADDPLIFKAIKTNSDDKNGAWATYEFYIDVQQENITNAKLKLSLGKYISSDNKSSLTEGYAFFDNIVIKNIDPTEYDNVVDKDDDNILKREIKAATAGGTSEPPENTNPGKHFDLENLAWMIPTIILAILTIIVVIVFAIKKIKRPKKASKSIEETEVDKSNENIVEKKNRYDDNME